MSRERKFIEHVKSCETCRNVKPNGKLCPVGEPLVQRAISERWGAGLAAQKTRADQENALIAFGVRKSPLERFEKKGKKRR